MTNSKQIALLGLIVIVLISHGIANLFVMELNNSLTTLSITLFLPGLFIAFPSLNLQLYPAILCNTITGILIDATTPIPMGTSAFVFLIVQLVVFQFRSVIKKNNLYHGWVIAQITNFVIFSFVTLYFNGKYLFEDGIFIRTLLDFIFSQSALAIIAPVYFTIIKKTIVVLRMDLYTNELSHK